MTTGPSDPLASATEPQRGNIRKALADQQHIWGEMSTGGQRRFEAERLQQMRATPHLHVLEHVAGRCLTPYGWDRADYAEISRSALLDLLRRAYEAGASAERSKGIAAAATASRLAPLPRIFSGPDGPVDPDLTPVRLGHSSGDPAP